jgi:hypothetical protein
MSQFTEDLKQFAIRLAKDGYPTALVERAAERMEAMEDYIVNMEDRNEDDWYDQLEEIAERSNN